MNRKMIILPLVVIFSMPAKSQTNVWSQRDSIKGPPKSSSVAFVAYTSGFVGTGFDNNEFKRSFFRYDPPFDDWDQLVSLGGTTGGGLERGSAVAFSIHNFGYVGLGQGLNPYFKDFWKYDPATDAWTQVADFGGTARMQAVGFAIDSLGYVGTGKDASGLTNDFWKYSPATNTWTPVASFAGTPRKAAVGITMGGLGYVGTGDDGVLRKDFWSYNPVTNTWAPIPDFGGTARSGATGFALYPSLFVGTGYDINLGYTNDFWEFNFWSNTWTQKTSFPGTPRAGAIAFAIGQTGYLGAGYDGDYTDDFYAYAIPTGVPEDMEATGALKIYPVPCNTQFTISAHLSFEIESVLLTDMSGRVIYDSGRCSPQTFSLNVPVESWSPGSYICRVTDKTGRTQVRKVNVAR